MIFVDTGALYARHVVRDQHHETARRGFRRIADERLPVATSIHVLDETFTLLGRAAGNRFAAERAREILAARTLRILRPTEDDEVSAVATFERLSDQRISFTDALSFALMKRQGIKDAFAFDRHFVQAGFSLWPPSE